MSQSTKLLRFTVVACLCGALFAFAYPMFVIRPFRPQGPNELAAALAVRSWGPVLATAAAAIAIIAMMLLWRRAQSRLARVATGAATAFTVLSAGLSHVNVYELMFHRIELPEAMPAAEAKLDGDDMVLAIRLDGEARAYPVRMMGYHHIVNDSVGGVPVAGTY